jgi:hypothetical protein
LITAIKRRKRLIALLAVLTLVGFTVSFCKGEGSGSHPFTGVNLAAHVQGDPTPRPATAQTCISTGDLAVTGGGVGNYKLNPDNFSSGDGNAVVCNSDGLTDYSIQSQTGSGTSPVAYPNIDAGCNSTAGGNCSTGWTEQEYSAIGDPVVYAAGGGSTGGTDEWDSLFDEWFAPATTGCPTVEIGMMFNGANLAAASGTLVTISGKNYYYKTEARTGSGCSWTYYLFRRQTFISSITNFDMKVLFTYVHDNGSLPATDLWRYEGVGNELWSGGAGLTMSGVSFAQ